MSLARCVVMSVVSYSISTSNHNIRELKQFSDLVVSYSISTSNHNALAQLTIIGKLYLIPFLHQTTTLGYCFIKGSLLYLIPFLHQTTTNVARMRPAPSLYLIPFLHQTTTPPTPTNAPCRCILFHFYIKPQQVFLDFCNTISCILFHFYIKPQLDYR